jgi:hypothetical protein
MKRFRVATTWTTLLAIIASLQWSTPVAHRIATFQLRDVEIRVVACVSAGCDCQRLGNASDRVESIRLDDQKAINVTWHQAPTEPSCPPNCWCHSERPVPADPVRTPSKRPIKPVVCLSKSQSAQWLVGQACQREAKDGVPPDNETALSRCVSACRWLL